MPVTPPIPSAFPEKFRGGICHPDLWLWDSWCCDIGTTTHLYTLALSRTDADGVPIEPHQRNEFTFHVRHFSSEDGGYSWIDRGAHLQPSPQQGSYFEQSVWSGSALRLSSGEVLMGFTGIRRLGAGRNFFQSMGIARLDGTGSLIEVDDVPFSCPHRDYQQIRDAGYYLGPKDALGTDNGEQGGPIMGWRDPFLIEETSDCIHAFWSAKISAREGCVAHAILSRKGDRFEIESLRPPISMPAGEIYTQTEVPKIYSNNQGDSHLMLISSCDRLYEGQPDSEVSKRMRLYAADTMRGPWHPYRREGSQVTNDDKLFGASAIACDFSAEEMSLVAPTSETAALEDRLTIAAVQKLSFGTKASDSEMALYPG